MSEVTIHRHLLNIPAYKGKGAHKHMSQPCEHIRFDDLAAVGYDDIHHCE